jgi:hypothetical protein
MLSARNVKTGDENVEESTTTTMNLVVRPDTARGSQAILGTRSDLANLDLTGKDYARKAKRVEVKPP